MIQTQTCIIILFQSKGSSDILRGTGLAIIGESAKGLGENASELSELMFSLVMPLIEDEDDSVRNNCVFALGEIAFYGKESIYKLVFIFVYYIFMIDNVM